MRYFVMLCALAGAGCSFTMHATAFKSSQIEALTSDSKVNLAAIAAQVPAPQSTPVPVPIEARNEAGQIVIGGVCYAESAVNLQGKRTVVLFPAVCQ